MNLSHLNWLRELPGRPIVVAEIKPRSPCGWDNPFHWRDQFVVCEAVGDIISVHTNELWGGSWTLLETIRSMTQKPILAKGFHDTIHDVQRALDCGATSVLTVGWNGGHLHEHCWLECESQHELRITTAIRAVWNARNPRTGEVRDEYTPVEARADRAGWLCQASHIRSPQDVVTGVDAILIGEGLYTSSL